jgi:hypothetical protein
MAAIPPPRPLGGFERAAVRWLSRYTAEDRFPKWPWLFDTNVSAAMPVLDGPLDVRRWSRP